ncbi:MAG: hypothetical protein RML32_08865, partial [Gammaproteobacteria bacterium]|nr:hypothetical protein [Gammaproteobacteria bacterium]
MTFRHICIVAALMSAAAACSRESTGEATASSAAAETTVRKAAREVDHTDLVRAVPTTKPGAPVQVKFDIAQRPVV